MTEALSREQALDSVADFFRGGKPFVLFGTGLSCAVDARFGMPALRERLLEAVPPVISNSQQDDQWRRVVHALEGGSDLESALDYVADSELADAVTGAAADFIAAVDREHGGPLLKGEMRWPAISLFRSLLGGLPPADPVLHVATTNYDMLAEYAFSEGGLAYATGFFGGIARRRDWGRVDRSFVFTEPRPRGGKSKPVLQRTSHIRLYKVHGSLNTFSIGNEVVENDAWISEPPEGTRRVMIAPGSRKYEELHWNRTELLSEYDRAVECHDSFLFLGFGFNDTQLSNAAVNRKLREQGGRALIVTRDSNPRIDVLLQDCPDVWLVCRHPDGGSRVANKEAGEAHLAGSDLWMFDRFAADVLGG